MSETKSFAPARCLPRRPASLAVSIVLYRPQAGFDGALSSLIEAIATAMTSEPLLPVRLLLTDHSPEAVTVQREQRWRALCPPWLQYDYRHDPRNPGFGAGHNAAWDRCGEADYFLVVNPDVEFAVDALQAGLRFLARHPGVGVIAPALVERDGSLRPACFRRPDPLTLLMRALGIGAGKSQRVARYECRDWDPRAVVFNPPCMSGCCLLFRGATFARLGGFDPSYFLYFEDFELSRRAAALGVSAYCPSMRVSHFGGGAAAKGWRHRWWFVRSALRYYLRGRIP